MYARSYTCQMKLLNTIVGMVIASTIVEIQCVLFTKKNRTCRPRNICQSGDTFLYRGQCLLCLSSIPACQDSESNTINHVPSANEALLRVRGRTGRKLPESSSSIAQGTGTYECPTTLESFSRKSVRIGAAFLNGRLLNIVTIQRHPFSKVNGDSYTGVIFELLDALHKKHNFSMHIFTPRDGNWGSREKNGSWNGMIGHISRKEADIGAASFSITLARAEVVDFTFAYHQEPTGILIPAPTEGEKFTVLIRPLSKEVWVSVFLTIGVIAPTFYVFHVCSLSITGNGGEVRVKTFLSTMSEILLFITGSVVQESVISPVNKTTRFLIAIWWMSTLVLANTYVAFLVSYLSAPKLHNIVNSLEELSHQSDIQWTFRKGTAHQTLFKSDSSSGVFKVIGDGVADSDLVTSDFDGVQRVLDGRHAFIKEKSFLDVALSKDFDETQKCRLTLTKESFFTVGIALVVQKKAPYMKLLDYEISNAVNTGLMEKWKTHHWPESLWCADAASYIIETRPRTRKIGLYDVSGAYFLLAVGLTTALLGFLFEVLVACSRCRSPLAAETVSESFWVTMK